LLPRGNASAGDRGEKSVWRHAWTLLRDTVVSFIDDGALSRGAAIAFYTVTSLAPVLLIVVGVAGIVYDRQAAQQAIGQQLARLVGEDSAQMLQSAMGSIGSKSSGVVASLVGIAAVIVTASGVFGEMQSTLNAIWKAEPQEVTVSRLIWARAVSLGLVGALGFLLTVSLVISAVLAAFGDYLSARMPFAAIVLYVLNTVVSLGLIAALFAAIYKVLPDKDLEWRDVIAGAVVTSVLFAIGKWLIALYIATSAVASGYGAAGSLLVVLLWVYYSTQIFLLGAEFTKVYATRHGSQCPERAVAVAQAG
jgi:membrane protein